VKLGLYIVSHLAYDTETSFVRQQHYSKLFQNLVWPLQYLLRFYGLASNCPNYSQNLTHLLKSLWVELNSNERVRTIESSRRRRALRQCVEKSFGENGIIARKRR